MNIVQKGLITIAVPLLIEILFVAGLMYLMEESDRDLAQEAHSKLVMRTAEHVGEDLLRDYTVQQRYAWFGEPEISRQSVANCFKETIESINKLGALVSDDPLQTARVNRLHAGAVRLTKLMLVGMDYGPAHTAQNALQEYNPFALKYVKTLVDEAVGLLGSLDEVTAAAAEKESRQEAVRGQHREQLRGFIRLGVVLNAVMALLVALYFYRSIARRLAMVFDNTRRLADAQPLHPVLPGKDELAQLDGAFHAMADSLNESSRKQRALIDNARDVICSLDTTSAFIAASNASITVFGYFPNELTGRCLLDYVSTGAQKKTAQELQLIKEGGERPPFETDFVCKDGRRIDILISALWSSADESLFCVVHDISEQKAAERLRQEVIQMVTHDLRSPLTAIQNFHDILEAGVAGELNQQGADLLSAVNCSTARMLTLINDLLDSERLESGKLMLEKTDVPVSALFERSIQSVAPLARVDNVTLQVCETDLKVFADEERLVQVLVNLLSNALKYSPQGGTVTLSALSLSPDMIEFRVSDQGRGVPANMLQSIFNRFEQVLPSDATKRGGSGVGLAICKALVELHGGSIWAESDTGKGSTFVFRIPQMTGSTTLLTEPESG